MTADNCADQGTFFKGNTPPDLNQTVAGNPTGTPSTLAAGVTYETIDGKNSLVKDFGQPTVVINAGGYNVYTGGSRAGIMSISGSNDGVTWTEIARAEAKSDGICGRYYLGDHDGPTFVKVISRDPVARTMVVDGGSWVGSDGTNTGDVADQETIVTGPSKSGTAKTDGVPASTTFRIKDSNGQWVDNTNSNLVDHSGGSAQNFYVKNASGRVALARLDP